MNNLIQGVDYYRTSIVSGQRCQQLKTHLFHVDHPWASLPFVERLVVEGAKEGYPGFVAAEQLLHSWSRIQLPSLTRNGVAIARYQNGWTGRRD